MPPTPATDPLLIVAPSMGTRRIDGKQQREKEAKRSGGKYPGGKSPVPMASRPWTSNWRCRELPVLPIGSCRAGLAQKCRLIYWATPSPARFWIHGCGHVFGPCPHNTSTSFWKAF
jgi:hypothetical protein